MSEVAGMASTYQLLNKSNIRANTKALIMAAQKQALNTSAVAHKIYHTVQGPRYRFCKQHEEPVTHIIIGCRKLAGFEYTEGHNNVASIVYRAICAKSKFEHSKNWWVESEKVVRNNYAMKAYDSVPH